MTLPPRNIYWRAVRPTDKVELRGEPGARAYVVNGRAVAYWGSSDAIQAQAYLDHLAGHCKGKEVDQADRD